jgi:hypothetical protein
MRKHAHLLTAALALAFLVAPSFAQQKSTSLPTSDPTAYDLRREATLVGTVVSYTAASPTLSPGAHVSLQTPGGVIDVHLGDPRFLSANHFSVVPGDTLRIIGAPVSSGKSTQFVARVIQKGTGALAVRSPRGFPLSYVAPQGSSPSRSNGVPL